MRLGRRAPAAERPSGRGLVVALGGALALLSASTVAEAQDAELAEDRPRIALEGHVLVWLRAELDAPDTLRFSVPLLRPALALDLPHQHARLKLKADLGDGDPRLLDAYVELHAGSALEVQVGRFKTAFSRLWMTSTGRLDLPDRGVTVEHFEAGRALGLMITGTPTEALRFHVGAFARGHAPLVLARLELTAYGAVGEDQTPSLEEVHPRGLAFGLGATFDDDAPASAGPRLTGGADMQLEEGPFTLVAEAFVRRDASHQAPGLGYGAVVQAGAFAVPRRLLLTARGNWLHAEDAPRGELVHTYEAALTGFLAGEPPLAGHPLELMLRYRFDASATAHRLTAQLQVSL